MFGNVIKDVYLELLDSGDFERDEDGVFWLDLMFSGSKHFFSDRTSVLGGAKIIQEVFQKFGITAEISGENPEKVQDYRYILSKNQKIAYFVQKNRRKIIFREPTEGTQIVIVDRSAEVDREFVEKLEEYKKKNPRVLVVFHARKETNEAEKRLAKMAGLVFLNKKIPGVNEKKCCFLSESGIKIGGIQEKWRLGRADMMTHLTLYSIAMATILGAITRGKKTAEAMKFARVNVENSKLNESLEFEKIEEIVEKGQREATNLREMAKFLVSNGKGILAADESGGSIHKKFENMKIIDDEKHRRDYRNIFLSAGGLEKYVNGVILFDETARQKADDGRNFVEFLTARGVVSGIKVDQGLVNFTNSEEKYTKGLEGLEERLREYYLMGLRFAKWRAAFEITDSAPSEFAIRENARILAEYARACQSENIVPIVEPEVVFDGNYSLNKSKEVTGKILRELFSELREKNVDISATILKVNMVIAGKKFPTQSTPEEVGEATAEVLRENVPEEIAGVVFLSGGQTVTQATENLGEVVKNHLPFPVTFSFARALQEPALEIWRGDNKNSRAAAEAFVERLKANCEVLKYRK